MCVHVCAVNVHKFEIKFFTNTVVVVVLVGADAFVVKTSFPFLSRFPSMLSSKLNYVNSLSDDDETWYSVYSIFCI